MAEKLYQSKLFLKRRYVMERRTLTEIAKECGTSIQTISNYLVKFGYR